MKQSVLLIEDNKPLLELYKTRFEVEGFKTYTAETAEDAIKIANKEKPSLYVVDIMLPDMSGYEVIRTLRGQPETKDAGIVVLTALENEENRQKALSLGADEFLMKSRITLEDVINVARSTIDKR